MVKVSTHIYVRHSRLHMIRLARFQQMVKKELRVIRSDTVCKMLRWGHFEFRQRLKQLGLRSRGVGIHEVTEPYTSKGCGRCLTLG